MQIIINPQLQWRRWKRQQRGEEGPSTSLHRRVLPVEEEGEIGTKVLPIIGKGVLPKHAGSIIAITIVVEEAITILGTAMMVGAGTPGGIITTMLRKVVAAAEDEGEVVITTTTEAGEVDDTITIITMIVGGEEEPKQHEAGKGRRSSMNSAEGGVMTVRGRKMPMLIENNRPRKKRTSTKVTRSRRLVIDVPAPPPPAEGRPPCPPEVTAPATRARTARHRPAVPREVTAVAPDNGRTRPLPDHDLGADLGVGRGGRRRTLPRIAMVGRIDAVIVMIGGGGEAGAGVEAVVEIVEGRGSRMVGGGMVEVGEAVIRGKGTTMTGGIEAAAVIGGNAGLSQERCWGCRAIYI